MRPRASGTGQLVLLFALAVAIWVVLSPGGGTDARPPDSPLAAEHAESGEARAERRRDARRRAAAERRARAERRRSRREAAERDARAERRQARRLRSRRAARRRAERERARRRDEARAVRARVAARRGTPRGAVLAAYRAGSIPRHARDTWLRDDRDARAALRRLPPARARELRYVHGVVAGLARERRLTPERMRVLFLQLRRNTSHWLHAPMPRHGDRRTFGSDPVVFQFVAGRGWQFHPIANFGKANALYNACRGHASRPGTPCRKRSLRRLLDRLTDLAVRRSGFTAWEYYFDFAGGRPPWISGMAQATGMQALARGGRFLRERSYLETAAGALGAFEHAPPRGVAARGNHYLLYGFSQIRVLNAFAQAVSGLHTYARVSRDERAWSLFRAGDRALRRELSAYDTGEWSLYARGGRDASLEYHRLSRDFLRNLCRRTGIGAYCTYSDRFTRYLAEPPRVDLRPIRGARRGRAARIRFTLSKRATVTLRVRRDGAVVHRRVLSLRRGRHELRFEPRRARRHTVAVQARGRNGRGATAIGAMRVRAAGG